MSTNRSAGAKKKKNLTYFLRHGTKTNAETTAALEKLTGGPLTLANVIMSLRLCDEMSQVDFAKLLGISRQQLCDIEKGRRQINVEKAAEFADNLGYPRAYFVKLALQSLIEDAGLDLRVEVA